MLIVRRYKRDIIPAFKEAYPLRLRSNDVLRFIAMKDSIVKYHYDDYFNPARDLNKENLTAAANGDIVKTTPNKYHTVRKGETLSSISRKYGVSVNQLKSMNRLHSNSLKIGQKLIVKKGTTIVVKAGPTVQDSTATVPVANPTDSTAISNNPLSQNGVLLYYCLPLDYVSQGVYKTKSENVEYIAQVLSSIIGDNSYIDTTSEVVKDITVECTFAGSSMTMSVYYTVALLSDLLQTRVEIITFAGNK